MWLIAGLGNPGHEYARTRHNVGFMVLEELARRWNALPWKERFLGLSAHALVQGKEVLLLQPHTYMNRSGESIQRAMAQFKISRGELLVIHDEIDLPLGTIRIKVGGGANGHNGLRSIIALCGGADFVRIRLGIGRPPSGSVEAWVLGKFQESELAHLHNMLDLAAQAAESVLLEGPEKAQNRFNGLKRVALRPEEAFSSAKTHK
ncbi:MAG: aminoacyl-tRNA hydrolase [Sandaracinaceae bacterium]|nr:aminoacyl-tRNA hydrolase [Sandaracinaceae bacterium]